MFNRLISAERKEKRNKKWTQKRAERVQKHLSAAFKDAQDPQKIEEHMAGPAKEGRSYIVPIWKKKTFSNRKSVYPFKGEIMENPDFQDFQQLLKDNGIRMDDIGVAGTMQDYWAGSEIGLKLRPTAKFNGTVTNTLPAEPRQEITPYTGDDYYQRGNPPWGSVKTL